MDTELELTTEQESKMIEIWNLNPASPPSIEEITQKIFLDEKLDGRSKQGKAVKKCLAKHNLQAITKTTYKPKMEFILTDDHKGFIRNHAQTMNGLEMARQILNNPTLTNLDTPTRVINTFIREELDSTTVFRPEDQTEIPEGDYRPPKRISEALNRTNQYVNYALDKDKLTAAQKRGIEVLINYLHNFRFNKQINTFDQESDRKTFEDSFIRYTYDKPDLTQEEIDQYILLATEVVMGFKAQRRHEVLQNQLEGVVGNDDEKIKISMSLVEAIGKANKEYNDCVGRQQDLLGSLKEDRSKRLSKQISDNASILNLVELWKMEETRGQLLKLAEREQKAIADEVDRITDMDDVKVRILGLTKEEAMLS